MLSLAQMKKHSTFSRSRCVAKPVGIRNSVNDRLGFVNLYRLAKLTRTNKTKPELDWGKQQTGTLIHC